MPKLLNNRLAMQLAKYVSDYVYNDTALLLHNASQSVDANGHKLKEFVEYHLHCSFNETPSRVTGKGESWTRFGDIGMYDAEVRFAEPEPHKGDLVRSVVLQGGDETLYTGKTYEIIGIINRGEFGWVCALRRVEV